MPVIWLIDAYRAGERGQVLALAQELAGEMGGTVHAVSTPGKGTLLTLWLPAEEG